MDDIKDLKRIEDNFNEVRERAKAKKLKRKEMIRTISSDESYSGSSNLSCFDSEASRVDFWKDINTKDSDYQNAVIVKHQSNTG